MSLLSDVGDWLHRQYQDEQAAIQDLLPYTPVELVTLLGSRSTADVIHGIWIGEATTELLGSGPLLAILGAGTQALTAGSVQALNQQYLSNLQGPGMAQLIIPNCFQVSIQMVAGGHVIENVVGVQNGGGTAAGAAAAVLAAWKVASGPLNGLSSFVTMVQVRAVDIGSSNGAIVVVPDTTAGGVSTAQSLATRGACALIQWNGGTRSRSSRGRLYYGPIMESNIDTDGATLVGVTSTTIKNRFVAFSTSLSGASYPLVVLSRTLSTAFPVTSVTCEQTIATQRRRIR